MVDNQKKRPNLGLTLQLEENKQDQELTQKMQDLTLEKKNQCYTEIQKDNILQIIACSQESQNMELKDFKKIKNLGKGASGYVDQVVHVPTNQIYAMKKIHYVDNETIQMHLSWEIKTLFTSDSDCIVKYHGAYFQDNTINIIQEFMDKGSLEKILKDVQSINDVILGEITFQILEGLNYLHKQLKIIHRDIKPANVLVNKQGKVKIADLGICGKIENTLDQKKTFVGTVSYMSPERLTGQPYTNNTDIWSLGLMLLECKLGKNPLNQSEAFFDVLKSIDDFTLPELPPQTNKHFADFLKQCLNKDPAQRPTAEQLLQHKFILKFTEKRQTIQENFAQWLQTID